MPDPIQSGTPIDAGALPALLSLEQVGRRLERIFPNSFPDRGILVGTMAVRVVYVFLYGGFVEGAERLLRPSLIYFFTDEQSRMTSEAERVNWRSVAFKQGHRPQGKRWYADTSKETIRDDLMRNRFLRMGVVGKLEGVPVNSSKPTYFLKREFAALFDPVLEGAAFDTAVQTWQRSHLDIGALQRMALRADGALRKGRDVFVDMPDGERMRMAAGPSAEITKALVERFAPACLKHPAVLWLSGSDTKSYPRFVARAASIGLVFDVKAELPDIIFADLSDPIRYVFCEVVASDGPMTQGRKDALLRIVTASGIEPARVQFLTAFDDPAAAPFRKNFSQLATDSLVWFRTEPELLVVLTTRGLVLHTAADGGFGS